jgi:hypothetical protein
MSPITLPLATYIGREIRPRGTRVIRAKRGGLISEGAACRRGLTGFPKVSPVAAPL